MPVIDTLEYKLNLNTRDLERGGQKAQSVLKRVDSAFGRLANISLAAGGVTQFGRALFGVGRQFIDAAATMESLMRGLTAVSGSARQAQLQMEELREVAKLPGLGLEEAMRGSINLQAAGLSAERATTSLKAFGNALATVGKGKADLQGVTLALTQIAAKGKLSAEEINQIAERVPQIRQVMKDAFGTAIPKEIEKSGISFEQFIDKVNVELLKLPQVTGGARNAFENLGDTLFETRSRLGELVMPAVLQSVAGLSGLLEDVNDALKDQEEKLKDVADGYADAQEQLDNVQKTTSQLAVDYQELVDKLADLEPDTREHFETSKKLDGVVQQLIKHVPALAAAWDVENGRLSNLNENLEKNLELRRASLKAEFVKGLDKHTQALAREQKEIARLTAMQDRLTKARNDGDEVVRESIETGTASFVNYTLQGEKLGELEKFLIDTNFNTRSLASGQVLLNTELVKSQTEIDKISTKLIEYVELSGKDAVDALDNLAKAWRVLESSGSNEETVAVWNAAFDAFSKKVGLSKTQIEAFLPSLMKLSQFKLEDVIKSVKDKGAGAGGGATGAKDVPAELFFGMPYDQTVSMMQDYAVDMVDSFGLAFLDAWEGGTWFPDIKRASPLDQLVSDILSDTRATIGFGRDPEFEADEDATKKIFGDREESAKDYYGFLSDMADDLLDQEEKGSKKYWRDLEKRGKAYAKAEKERQRQLVQGYQDVTGAVMDIAGMIGGDLGQGLATAVDLADDFANAFIHLAKGNVLGAVTSGVVGVAGVLQQMFGESGSDRDRKERQRQTLDHLRTESETLGQDVAEIVEFLGEDIARSAQSLEAQLEGLLDLSGDGFLSTGKWDLEGWNVGPGETIVQRQMNEAEADIETFQHNLAVLVPFSERIKSDIETIFSGVGDAIAIGIRDSDMQKAVNALDVRLDDLLRTSVEHKILGSQMEEMAKQFSTQLEVALQDEFITGAETAELQTARNTFTEQFKSRLQIARQLTKDLGLDLFDQPSGADETGPTGNAGMSVAIRQITSRQADELALVFAGVQATNREIANNTLRTADTLELYLPTLADRIDMMDNGLSPGRSSRGEAQQLTETRRSKGNLNG